MPAPKCPKCQHRTTAKQIEKSGMCRACFAMDHLEDFDRPQAARMLKDMRGRRGLRWDSCLTEIRKRMKPPKDKKWTLPLVIEIDSARLNWGTT